MVGVLGSPTAPGSPAWVARLLLHPTNRSHSLHPLPTAHPVCTIPPPRHSSPSLHPLSATAHPVCTIPPPATAHPVCPTHQPTQPAQSQLTQSAPIPQLIDTRSRSSHVKYFTSPSASIAWFTGPPDPEFTASDSELIGLLDLKLTSPPDSEAELTNQPARIPDHLPRNRPPIHTAPNPWPVLHCTPSPSCQQLPE